MAGTATVRALMPAWAIVVACGLFASRFLVPAESAAAGDTSWLVFGWLLWTLIIAGFLWKKGLSLPFDRCDGLLAFICLTPWLSLASLHVSGGDLRSGWNCSWEWAGNFFAVYWLRHFWRQGHQQLILSVITCLVISASLLGIYQAHISFPALRNEYLPLLETYQQTRKEVKTEGDTVSVSLQRKLAQQERELYENGIPLDPQAQQMFEQRLNSSEPFSRFALANTLAGFLLVGWLLLGGSLLEKWQNRFHTQVPMPTWVIGGIFFLLLTYCLLLTKSRTAWVGLLGGLICSALLYFFVVQQTGADRNRWRGLILGSLAGGLFLILLIGLGLGTGMLDIEVLTESNKSLKYRYEYWSATLAMLKQYWLMGVGPGQFRQTYLAYKLPQSSEEILDPHNFLLESWCTGGILSLLGLLVLFGLLLQSAWRIADLKQDDGNEHHHSSSGFSSLAGAILVAFVCSGLFVSPNISTDIVSQLGLLVTTFVVACLMNFTRLSAVVSPAVLFGSAFGLSIHLLGAGGYGMPAICQLWLFLLLIGVRYPSANQNVLALPGIGVAAGSLCLLLLGIIFVIHPHQAGLQAESDLFESRSFTKSLNAISDWKKADGWSAEPWLQAGNFYRQSISAVRNREEVGKQAVAEYAGAAHRDPRNYFAYQQQALVQEELFQLLPDQTQFLEQAYENQLAALLRYPTSPPIVLGLARIASQCPGREEESRKYAQLALDLHEINRTAGHKDKELNPLELEELESLLR